MAKVLSAKENHTHTRIRCLDEGEGEALGVGVRDGMERGRLLTFIGANFISTCNQENYKLRSP